MSTGDRWIGQTRGTVEEIQPFGRQWQLKVDGTWFTTKAGSSCNQLLTCGLLGQTVLLSYEHVKNPKHRRVHHIATDMYPTIPGTE